MKKRKLFNSKKPTKDNKPREPKPDDTADVQAVASILSRAELPLFEVSLAERTSVRISRVNDRNPAEPRARTRYSPMGRLNFDDNITSDEDDE